MTDEERERYEHRIEVMAAERDRARADLAQFEAVMRDATEQGAIRVGLDLSVAAERWAPGLGNTPHTVVHTDQAATAVDVRLLGVLVRLYEASIKVNHHFGGGARMIDPFRAAFFEVQSLIEHRRNPLHALLDVTAEQAVQRPLHAGDRVVLRRADDGAELVELAPEDVLADGEVVALYVDQSRPGGVAVAVKRYSRPRRPDRD